MRPVVDMYVPFGEVRVPELSRDSATRSATSPSISRRSAKPAAAARTVVFPELSLTRYMLRDMVSTVALRLERPSSKHLKKQSQKIGILVGLVEETRAFRFTTPRCSSTAACRSSTARSTCRHIGMFDEQRYFARGAEVRASTAASGVVRSSICEDL